MAPLSYHPAHSSSTLQTPWRTLSPRGTPITSTDAFLSFATVMARRTRPTTAIDQTVAGAGFALERSNAGKTVMRFALAAASSAAGKLGQVEIWGCRRRDRAGSRTDPVFGRRKLLRLLLTAGAADYTDPEFGFTATELKWGESITVLENYLHSGVAGQVVNITGGAATIAIDAEGEEFFEIFGRLKNTDGGVGTAAEQLGGEYFEM